MAKFDYLDEQLRRSESDGLLRRLRSVSSGADTLVTVDSSGRRLVNFSSNNYLNLAADPLVIEAACAAVRKWGFGASASRLICGTAPPHMQAEAEFAAFFRKEAALLFTSGWTANEAALGSLPQRGDLVLMDKADHASIIDAAAASPADFRTYRRGDLARLRRLLESTRYRRKFIVTESIFSMDGDCADLAALVELKKAHDAFLVVDEAHSVGCIGPTGAGLAEAQGLLDDVDIVVAPLGKAFGTAGAIIAAERVVIEYLVNRARPFIFTTAPPPANCAAALAALKIVRDEPDRRIRLADKAAFLRSTLAQRGLDTGGSSTHIIPVMIDDPQKTLRAAERLLEEGFLLVAIRPPTVQQGTSRLRISVQAAHTQDHLEALADALARVLHD